MYNLDEYGQMIADKPRMDAYMAAIARAVRPGDVVADIGCAVGIFALLACRAGARRVYAIEGSEIVQWGKKLAAANGFSEKIEFLQGDSRQIQLPERVNLVVSDVRGSLPLFGEAIESIEDARRRFLLPGGIQIPISDTLYAAIVDAGKTYEGVTAPWRQPLNGLDLRSVLPTLLNATYNTRVTQDTLLTEPQEWCHLEYAASPSKRAAAKLKFKALRQGVAHGIALWFETQLFEEILFSSGPSDRDPVYGRMFLSWPEPVTLNEGDEVEVGLHADLVGSAYIWRWETQFPGKDGQAARNYRQSTFESAKFSHEGLRRRASEFVPSLTELGEAQRWMLQAMDGKATLEEIAQEAAKRFPKVLRTLDEALRSAGDLSREFSR